MRAFKRFLIIAVFFWGLMPPGMLFAAQSDSITLRVRVDNSLPIPIITSPIDGTKTDNPGILVEGTIDDISIDKVTLIARLYDGTDYNIIYQWWDFSASDGKFSIDLRDQQYLRHGWSRVEVSVKDAAGNSGWTCVYILLNNVPSITSFSPTNNSSFTELDTIPISVSATDLDNDSLIYKFSVDGATKQDWSSNSAYNWQTQSGDSGTHILRVDMSDNNSLVTKEVEIYVWRKPVNIPNHL